MMLTNSVTDPAYLIGCFEVWTFESAVFHGWNVKSVFNISLETLYVKTQFSKLKAEFWVSKGANLMNSYEGSVTDFTLNDRWKL